jgi:hypothetical protein
MSDSVTAATGPRVFTLAKPITVIDATVTSVTITPPTGRHLMKAGSVMRFVTRADSDETSVEVNAEGMGKLIAACCNIPLRSVEMMAAGDFMMLSAELMGFLAPTATS